MEGTPTTRNSIEVPKWDCRKIADKLGDNTESSDWQDFFAEGKRAKQLIFYVGRVDTAGSSVSQTGLIIVIW